MEQINYFAVNSLIEVFQSEDGTFFHKGPFMINGLEYDFKFIDSDGEDYCSIEQMKEWNIQIKKIIR